MRSRLVHALLTLATLVVATLVWLVPGIASASERGEASEHGEAIVTASLAASFAPQPAAPAPIGPAAPTTRAPLCDPRGATTFASPPQMQDVEVTLDTGLTLDDCMGTPHGSDANQAAPGRAPLPIDAYSASDGAAMMNAAVVLAASGRELLPAPAASTTCSRPGIRSTVDRPPRA